MLGLELGADDMWSSRLRPRRSWLELKAVLRRLGKKWGGGGQRGKNTTSCLLT